MKLANLFPRMISGDKKLENKCFILHPTELACIRCDNKEFWITDYHHNDIEFRSRDFYQDIKLIDVKNTLIVDNAQLCVKSNIPNLMHSLNTSSESKHRKHCLVSAEFFSKTKLENFKPNYIISNTLLYIFDENGEIDTWIKGECVHHSDKEFIKKIKEDVKTERLVPINIINPNRNININDIISNSNWGKKNSIILISQKVNKIVENNYIFKS